MQNNNFNQSNTQKEVVYSFAIDRYEVFTSRSYQRYLKLIVQLWNENEGFEMDQLYELNDDDSVHLSFYRFVDQFRQFGEVNDEVYVDDLIGERGTCQIKYNYSHSRSYPKIVLTSWEGNENE